MANTENGSGSAGPAAPAERVHDLYWSSDRSVNAIAEELGISKGRLYDLIRPIPADSPCPECGGPRVFENRTARDRNDPTCPRCEGLELDGEWGYPVSSPLPDAIAAIPADSRALVAGVVLGVAAGLLLAQVFRR